MADSPAPTSNRYGRVDMARGWAIVLMLAYHFTFDLNMFGVVRCNFNHDWFWLSYRVFAMIIFVGLVGLNLVLAERSGFKPGRYFLRLFQVSLGAALATISSYLTFPETYIFFGILHFILVASIVGRLFVGFYRLNLALGLFLVFIELVWSHPWFNQPLCQWIGLMTHKPFTEDYVPMIPWFGYVLLGMFLARHLERKGRLDVLHAATPLSRGGHVITFLGRHSLIIYLLHQPILIGTMYLVLRLIHS